jgi:hypothetical protein
MLNCWSVEHRSSFFCLLQNVWVCVCVGFVLCVSFGNMCTCIYFVLHCLYCVLLYCFVYVYVSLLVLSVLPPNDSSIAVQKNNVSYHIWKMFIGRWWKISVSWAVYWNVLWALLEESSLKCKNSERVILTSCRQTAAPTMLHGSENLIL